MMATFAHLHPLPTGPRGGGGGLRMKHSMSISSLTVPSGALVGAGQNIS